MYSWCSRIAFGIEADLVDEHLRTASDAAIHRSGSVRNRS